MNLDLLIDAALADAELSTGVRPELVARRRGGRSVALFRAKADRKYNPQWTEQEDAFLTANHGYLSEAEIAAALGRTPAAVRIRWKRELRLPPPSKHPDVLTAEHVGMGLAKDGKSIHLLMDTGRMPCRRLPSDAGDVCRVVSRTAFLVWLLNPENWIYFHPERVGRKLPRGRRGFTPAPRAGRVRAAVYDDLFWQKARRLLEMRRARWEDEWWTPGQTGAYHGLSQAFVNDAIHKGRLPAVRWGNWWIKRSDAVAIETRALRAWVGKGGKGFDRAPRGVATSPRADAFVVLASAVGLTPAVVGPMMGWNPKRVDHRLRVLRRRRRIAGLIAQHHLPVQYNSRSGALFADWRDLAARFPDLARIVRRFASGADLPRRDLACVRGVLHTWARWHARTRAQRGIEYRLRKFGGRHTAAFYRRMVDEMIAAGLGDPCRDVGAATDARPSARHHTFTETT